MITLFLGGKKEPKPKYVDAKFISKKVASVRQYKRVYYEFILSKINQNVQWASQKESLCSWILFIVMSKNVLNSRMH